MRAAYSAGVPAPRFRCTACGNLTRFDVTLTRRSRSFHHYTVGGELTVEDEEVLDEVVEDVSCRWCGSGRAVVALDGSGEPGATGAGGG
ncbi:MAG: hypothetical protein ACRD0N_12135 [Acidimicrobiales bacterium]